ncbi:DUF3331 domain-containing protein [Paraburkholderia sp. 35.1]|uniref:DUF3331 domain-containing protein n=2 Tax=Paraburkholderia TaxID=1822464 RepID=UPI003D25573E
MVGSAHAKRKRSSLHRGSQVMNRAVDPWSMTVTRLGDWKLNERATAHGSALNGSSVRQSIASTGKPIIRVLDQPTAQTLIVSWCDARSGHYGYQTWCGGAARVPGICALTGRLIEVGDAIYRPRLTGPTPANAHAMICARSVSLIEQPI